MCESGGFWGSDLRRIVMTSGGLTSWAAGKRVAQRHGTADLWHLFTDTLIEDEDCYRLLVEGTANVHGVPEDAWGHLRTFWLDMPPLRAMPARKRHLLHFRVEAAKVLPMLVWLADGRTPWEVYRDERMLGNSRMDPCSKILKRELAARWLKENCDPAGTVVYVGIHWSEMDRFTAEACRDKSKPKLKERRAADGWTYAAPLCEPPLIGAQEVVDWLAREGIALPKLYGMGFEHNNCSGFCCKAGQSHFARVLEAMPDRYALFEEEEQDFREFIGRDVAHILEKRNRRKRPLTLKVLRERIEDGQAVPLFEGGTGCSCFAGAD
jgi:hypothetical protein